MFHNSIVKISEKLNKQNLLKICLQFTFNHDKNLQIDFVCVKCQAKNDFPKDVKSTVTKS